ncbi:MAG: hypothetical protein ACK6DK_02075 [Gemmatimonadota bacterium]
MRTLVFDTHSYDRAFLDAANAGRHLLEFTTAQLDAQTAALARGFDAVCLFVNDRADAAAMAALAAGGVRTIVQRSTGYNNLDLEAAARHGIACFRVRDYSPHAVAEFAVALLQTLNRKTTGPTTGRASTTSGSPASSAATCTARRWAWWARGASGRSSRASCTGSDA